MTINLTRLGAGLRVVTKELPALRSAAVGFWVGTGSRDEPDDATAGASHFLEHLLFKGTARRSALEIAQTVESVGGDMNAFTTQELTAFYVRVPDERLDIALDILSDIVWEPALRLDDVESERQVILEEIRMRDDTPDDLVHDLFSSALFPDHPLGREVLGTQPSIGAMSRDAIADYHRHHYRPANVVVAAAGNLTHQAVVDRVAERMPAHGDRPDRTAPTGTPPRPLAVLARPTEQAHVVLGTRGLSRHDPDRYSLTVLNQALGGGMASRLFQEVRERRGLAYSVYSYRNSFADAGALAVYVGTAPGRVEEALAVVDGELNRLVDEGGITDDELDAAKGHLKGSIALSLESSISRMHRIGSSELTLGEIPTLDEVVARVDAVGPADVARVVDRVIGRGDRTLAVVGPFEEADFRERVA
jgi:predicted Zn-dependent peptidase